MPRFVFLISVLCSAVLVAAPVMAESPNLQPGLWAYDTVSTVEGPVNLPPQNMKNKECLTQQDLDKGVDMLNIPKQCTLTRTDIRRDRADFAATCTMGGMNSFYQGHSIFSGNQLNGQMRSETQTPLGPMIMNMTFKAKRVGECRAPNQLPSER